MNGAIARLAHAALFALLAIAQPALAKDQPKRKGKPLSVFVSPTASEVVVRRQQDLGVALQIALSRVKGLTPASNVAIVIDSTEASRQAKPAIAAALASLSALANRPQAWQVGGLGGGLCAPVKDPALLEPSLETAMLRKATPPPLDTLGCLLRAARKATGTDGVVLYLAHARFEDGVDLEGFIAAMKDEHRTLCVVGPEAAFERPWSDPVPGLDDRVRGFYGEKLPGAGTSPFEADDPEAPWRSGDTAFPHGPYRFSVLVRWDLEFRVPYDYRTKERRPADPFAEAKYPAPSSFGAYGLMRAAGATGGCYVLWSWTQSDGPSNPFDYVRCNDLGPDLRSRSEIADELPRRPLAIALLDAWNTLAASGIADTTPPRYATRPATMRESRGGDVCYLIGIYAKPSDRDADVAGVTQQRDLLDRVLNSIGRALTDAGPPKDGIDRRYLADVELLEHALRTMRFRTNEFLLGIVAIPKSAWGRKAGRDPHLVDESWIRPSVGDKPWTVEDVALADPAAGAKLLADRRAFLEKYKGTPYAAIVERNYVWAFKLGDIGRTTGGGSLPSTPHGKGSSSGAPAPPPGPGSTGTPGPTTGK